MVVMFKEEIWDSCKHVFFEGSLSYKQPRVSSWRNLPLEYVRWVLPKAPERSCQVRSACSRGAVCASVASFQTGVPPDKPNPSFCSPKRPVSLKNLQNQGFWAVPLCKHRPTSLILFFAEMAINAEGLASLLKPGRTTVPCSLAWTSTSLSLHQALLGNDVPNRWVLLGRWLTSCKRPDDCLVTCLR